MRRRNAKGMPGRLFGRRAEIGDYSLTLLIKFMFAIAVCLVIVLIVSQGYSFSQGSRSADAGVFANSLLFSRALMRYDPIIDRLYASNVDDKRFFAYVNSEDARAISAVLEKYGNGKYAALSVQQGYINYSGLDAIRKSLANITAAKADSVYALATKATERIGENLTKAKNALRDSYQSKPGVDYISARITLYDTYNKTNMTGDIYYNEDNFRRNLVYVLGKFTKGQGGYELYHYTYPVLIGDDRRPGLMDIDVIIPNR